MKLVILVTPISEKGFDVALSWQEAGAPGVTIIRAHGLYALQQEASRGSIELPMMIASMASALAHIIDDVEERGYLIFSVVEPALVDKLIEVTNKVLGDLLEPNTGVLFVIDVERAVGVHRRQSNS